MAIISSSPSFTPAGQGSITVNKSFFRIGDQLITLEKYGKAVDHPFVFVSLHSDETSYINAGLRMAHSQKAFFIRLVNKQGRNVEADLFDRKLVFDPNSIFTSWGRRIHLKSNDCWSKSADDYVQQFARFVLNEMPGNKTIVMLHPGKPTLQAYHPGGAMEKMTKEIYVNPAMDAGQFFITADEDIFSQLKESKYNAVLQHAKKMDDDGSLAVFCAKSARPYIYMVANEGEEEMIAMLDGL